MSIVHGMATLIGCQCGGSDLDRVRNLCGQYLYGALEMTSWASFFYQCLDVVPNEEGRGFMLSGK